MSSKKSDRAQYQSGLKKLREVGLYTGKADARKKPSPYLKSILKKYSDVLSGKAIVVENKAAAKLYKGTFRTSGDLVIIPKAKGEKIYASKKTGEITTTRKFGKQTIKSTMLPGGGTASEAKNKAKGYYVLHLKHGGMRFQSYDEMVRTVNEVSPKLAQAVAGGFDWKKWVTFETVGEGRKRQAQGKKYGRKK